MTIPEGAAAITYEGRSSIQKVRAILVEQECRIIYGDTDSLMFQIPGYSDASPELGCRVIPEVIAAGNRLTEQINTTLPKPMTMEFEKVINAVFIDKKRYVGYITWPLAEGQKPKVFVRGAASVRGDTTPFARQLYTTILSMILEDKTREEVVATLENSLEELRAGHVPNAMLSVSKMLAHSYASPSAPMNVYARYLVSIGELAEAGTKIPLIVTKQSREGPRALSYRLPTTEDPIDYEYYAEMARRPLDKLLEAAFLEAETAQ
jgi:DNA polymerase elongation subunit (family B)